MSQFLEIDFHLFESLSEFAKDATLQILKVEAVGDVIKLTLHDTQYVIEASLNNSYRSMIPYLKISSLVKPTVTTGGVNNLHIVSVPFLLMTHNFCPFYRRG